MKARIRRATEKGNAPVSGGVWPRMRSVGLLEMLVWHVHVEISRFAVRLQDGKLVRAKLPTHGRMQPHAGLVETIRNGVVDMLVS